MKFLILLLAVVAFAYSEYTEEQEEKWRQFKLENAKFFLSPGKEATRKEAFLQNCADVEAHNEAFLNGEVTYVKGIHKHSDLPYDTFLSRYGGVNKPADADIIDESKLISLRQTPPASVDLRRSNGIGAIRDQSQCGSCWTFSTVSTVEYTYWAWKGQSIDLSEQQLVDCVYGSAGGCDGGWMPTAMDWIDTNKGIAYEKDYPYTGVSGVCKKGVTNAMQLKVGQPWYQFAGDDNTIKSALADYGVLAVCVDAAGWSPYKSGIFMSSKYNKTLDCTHAVSLVGYGTENDIPYWIIRNSWNTWWGENGYMRLDARRAANGNIMGGILLQYTYYAVMY